MIWLLVLAFLASLSASAPVAAQGVGGPGGNPNNPIAPNQPCPDDSNRIANTHFVHECGTGGGGGGTIPLGLGFTITPGQDNPAAGALATPLTIGTNTLYGQIDPLPFFVDTPITAAMMGHNVKAMAGVSILFTLGQAGTTGFEKGVSVCFAASGGGGLTLTAAGGSLIHGVPVASNIMTSPQYGNGCAASDGTDWDVSWAFPAGGGGIGTVTSIAAGSHITNTPDPIIATGTVAFSQMATNTVVANPTSGTANAQDLAVPSCSADHEALQWLTNTGFQCPTDFAQFDKNQTWTENQAMPPVILTDGSSIATNGLLRNYYKVTLTGDNHVLSNPTNTQPGNYTWFVYTGAGFTGFSTDTAFKFVGGTPAWSSTAGKEDVISCLVDDTLTMACFAGIDVGGAGGGLALPNAHIYAGNSSNIATDVAVSGDLTLANTGAFTIVNNAVTTAKILNANVTYAKIQNEGASSLLGNPTGSPAAPSEITLGSGLSFSGTTLVATGSGGTVTSVATNNGITGGTITATGTIGLASVSANTVLGALTATFPSGLALPSCTDTGGNHLNYTNGTGFSCGTSGGGAASLTIGSSTISGGTTARLLYDNSAVLGETALTYNGTTITGVPTPSGSTDAASKSYVDSIAAAINPAVAVKAATTQASDTSGLTYTHVAGIGDFFTGSVNTAITFDGVTLTAVNQRVLIKNDTQSPSGAFNGVYYLSQLQTGILAPILIRALDYDQPSDINNTGAIPVVSGTVNALTSWLLTSAVATVGTDPLTYSQFSFNPATAGANPTGTVGLSTVNGSAATFLRSDGAPPLSQSISPTWTGTHIFTNSLLKLLGSSTGATTFTSANAGASNFTLTLPAATDTVAVLATAQTWNAVNTYGNSQITPNNAVVATLLATGTSVSLTGPREYYVCTGTCTVTPPVPVAGYEFCVLNDDNVSTAITLAALGSSARYENTARTAYGTAGTGTLSATAVVGNKVCILGLDSTHYLTTTFTGTWTAS